MKLVYNVIEISNIKDFNWSNTTGLKNVATGFVVFQHCHSDRSPDRNRDGVEESGRNSRMQKQHQYYVYIMATKSGVLYIGVTNDLIRRVTEHKHNLLEGFTKQYHCHELVYIEQYQWIQEATARETQLKKWNREKKESAYCKIESGVG